jgi:hypothetical protein
MSTRRSTTTAKQPKAAVRQGQFKRGRKPHNATSAPDYQNVAELIQLVGSEPRTVLVPGEAVGITGTERMMRLQLDRAMQGKAQDVREVLSLMLRYPDISCSGRIIIRVVLNSVDSRL